MKDLKRILFTITYYHPYVSGLTLYVKRLSETFVDKGHQVTVLTMQYDRNLPEKEITNGVNVERAKTIISISKGFLSFDYLKKSWREARCHDISIINLPQFEGLVLLLISRFLGKKVYSVYHCEIVLPSGVYNKFIQAVLQLSNYLTLFLSDKIICYTKDFAEHSRLVKPFLSKTEYIYPPIPVPKIDYQVKTGLKSKIKYRKNDVIIGIAARLAREKGIEYTINAIPLIAKKLNRNKSAIKLVIAGPQKPVGEESYRRKIMKLIKKNQDNVFFLGTLSQNEMGAFYDLCHVLALPSINNTEAFGMVQVESMLTGTPVVASDLPGVRVPVVKSSMGLVVSPKDSSGLAEAICRIILEKNIFTKTQKYIRNTFDIGLIYENYKEIGLLD